MTIGCDHPRPKLNMPGYTPVRLAWKPPAVMPTDPAGMARVLLEAFRGLGAALQEIGQKRTIVPLLDDIDARAGQVIVGVANGQIIRLPTPAPGDLGEVGIVLTDVVTPITVVNPDGTTTEIGTAGAYDFVGAIPDFYSTNPGGTVIGGTRPALSVIGRAAGTSGASGDISATGRRQVLATNAAGTALSFQTLSAIFPGAPIYDVMAYPFNATGSLAADDTAALNAAIAAANAAPGIIYLGPAHRITAGLDAITSNNVRLIGRGEFNGGTILQVDSAAAVDAITVSGCQYVGIERMWITGTKVFSSGYGVRFVGTFRCYTDRLIITTMCFGVEHVNCVLSEVRRTNLGDLYGLYGFLAHGTGGNFNHAVRYECCVCGTDYPATVVGTARVWAASTAYVVGNIVFANNNIYQCVQSGTSGASAPSGSGTTATNAHTTQITDGTAKWVFAMPRSIWFCQESGSQTFEVIDCGTLQGGYGLLVADSAGSTPLFTRVQNLQIDHPFTAGIQLDAGAAARMNQVFVTSVLEGSGIVIGSGHSGGWEFIGGEVFGTGKAGMTVAYGDGIIDGVTFASIGLTTTNTRDGIEVTNSATRFTIANCHIGTATGASNGHRYGISVAASSDNYVIDGNRLLGSLTAPLLNTPGQATTRVLRNNIPKWADHVASDGSEAFTLVAGTQTLTLLATTNVVFITVSGGVGDVVIDLISHAAGNAGVEVTIHKVGTGGRVILRDGNVGTNSIWTPGSADYVLTAYSDAVTVRNMTDGGGFARWRAGTDKQVIGLTDGDKGDITVTASGVTWTIDADVVTFAKMQNVGYGVIGNPTFGTTADPRLITPPGSFTVLQDDGTGTLAFHSLATTSIVHGALGVYERAALTGAITAAQNSNATLFDTNASGAGLVGGGTAIMAVGAGAGITVNANDVAVTIPLTDGDKGDITVSASGATWTVDNDVVTNAKAANMATATIKGRTTAGTGDPEDLTAAQAAGVLVGQFPPNNAEFVTYSANATLTAERVTTSSTTVTVSTSVANQIEFQRAALTGDVTASANSNATTIASDAVTFAKMQNIGYGILGNPTFATTVDPSLITPSGGNTVLQDDGSGVIAFRSLATTSVVHGTGGKYERAALTGDVTATQNSNATTIANDVVTFGKFQNIGYGVIGNPTFASTTDPSLIAPSGGFQVLYDNNAGALVFATLVTNCYSNSSVTLAKMADLAQSRIIGRAEGAGTGVPTSLTPTQVVAIIDGESPVWSASHEFDSFVQFGGATGLPVTGDIRKGSAANLIINSGATLSAISTGTTSLAAGTLFQASAGSGMQLSTSGGAIQIQPTTLLDVSGSGPFVRVSESSASTPSVGAGNGMYWVKNDAPSNPMFTDDTEVDRQLVAASTVAVGDTIVTDGTTWKTWSDVHFTAATTTIVTNSLTKTNALLLSVPANGFVIGGAYELDAVCSVERTTLGVSSLTVRLITGGVDTADSGVISCENSAGTNYFWLRGLWKCSAVGGSGAIQTSMSIQSELAARSAPTTGILKHVNSSAMNTTGVLTIGFNVQFGAAVANLSANILTGWIRRVM